MQTELTSVLEAVPLPALVIGQDARILAANAAAQDLLGMAITGRHYMAAIRQPALLEAVETTLRHLVTRECDYLTSDGQQDVLYRVSLRPVSVAKGGGVMLVFEDVSQAAQIGQMRRDFVANVSHELRTPLTALIGFIETLKGPARNDPVGQARFLDIMEREAHRMNRLVADLLSLSRVEANERVRPTDRVEPADVIRATVNALMHLADEARVEVVTHLPADRHEIRADPDQLRQVMTNLIENAIKYSGADTQVVVTLSDVQHRPRLRGDGVVITVQDTGVGIDPIHIPRLTERFYRIDSHRSREQGGTGLGLAIVKHIVNRHRGRLRVQSVPGQGACFEVELPVS